MFGYELREDRVHVGPRSHSGLETFILNSRTLLRAPKGKEIDAPFLVLHMNASEVTCDNQHVHKLRGSQKEKTGSIYFSSVSIDRKFFLTNSPQTVTRNNSVSSDRSFLGTAETSRVNFYIDLPPNALSLILLAGKKDDLY